MLPIKAPSRRGVVASLLAAALTVPLGASAQTVTDWEKTNLLRNGLTPRPERPGSTGEDETNEDAHRPHSAIPSREPLRVEQDNRQVEVVVDPYRSVEFNIAFAWDSAELSPWAMRQLAVLGRLLQSDLRPWSYLIAGHTDASGLFDYNIGLSMRRAQAVRGFLIRQFGVESNRLYVAGLGSTALRDPSRPYWAGNRRVEIILVKHTIDR